MLVCFSNYFVKSLSKLSKSLINLTKKRADDLTKFRMSNLLSKSIWKEGITVLRNIDDQGLILIFFHHFFNLFEWKLLRWQHLAIADELLCSFYNDVSVAMEIGRFQYLEMNSDMKMDKVSEFDMELKRFSRHGRRREYLH